MFIRFSRHLKLLLALALTAWAQIGFAQLPEPLSTDPEGIDSYLERAFRPYFFDPVDDDTQWHLQWRTYHLNRSVDNADDPLT